MLCLGGLGGLHGDKIFKERGGKGISHAMSASAFTKVTARQEGRQGGECPRNTQNTKNDAESGRGRQGELKGADDMDRFHCHFPTKDAGIRERPSKVKSSARRRIERRAVFESTLSGGHHIRWRMALGACCTIDAGGRTSQNPGKSVKGENRHLHSDAKINFRAVFHKLIHLIESNRLRAVALSRRFGVWPCRGQRDSRLSR